MNTEHKFVWLDFVRGLSAIAVCLGHLRAATIVDYAELGQGNLLQKAFYAATGLGHQSVMVFFVLSGFFVGGSVLRSGAGFNAGRYALARLSRLWVVLVPALLLTAVVDQVLASMAPDVLSGGYKPIWNSGPVDGHDYSSSWSTLLGNLVFVQTILTPVFGINSPLWSLANEFWYYVLFPLCSVAIGWSVRREAATVAPRVVAGALAVAILFWLPADIRDAYSIWLMGLVVYFSRGRLSPTLRRVVMVVGLVAFAASLGYSKSDTLQARLGWPVDPTIGVCFCILCVALANLPMPKNMNSMFVRLSHGMSTFSYSLYLSHFPLVALIGALGYGTTRVRPDLAGILQFTGWLALLLVVGGVFWWLFERKTDEVRRFVAGLPKRYLHASGS
ncbi:acyltransferase [Variovorax sp. dw_954]|uniref:acyltransferase family protein n=1 Tax=Variovorax sp. dw_954 TaxID=2720078 RepID=UPI001BD54594|nr:acyltransferase [Variovorax sp. dw_954]